MQYWGEQGRWQKSYFYYPQWAVYHKQFHVYNHFLHRLTSQLLEKYPFSQYATPQTIQHGHAYQKDGPVWSME
jgi:hypothetical protein